MLVRPLTLGRNGRVLVRVFSQRNLSSRHLAPMVEAGQLARRYPDSPNHPAQAYRATTAR